MSELPISPPRFDVDDIVSRLRLNMRRYGGPKPYILGLPKVYNSKAIGQTLGAAAHIAENLDRINGTSTANRSHTRTFYLGTLAGVRAVDLSPGLTELFALSGLDPEGPADGPQLFGESAAGSLAEQLERGKSAVDASAEKGYGLIAKHHDIIHGWGAAVTTDYSAIGQFGRGFGFSMQLAQREVDKRFVAYMEQLDVPDIAVDSLSPDD